MAEKLTLFKDNTLPSASLDEHDIDITPMMNMFIILVTFLVSMAVFTHVAIIDFSLPPNVGAGLDMSKGKPKVKVTVRLGSDYMGVVLGDKLLDSLPVVNGKFSLTELSRSLSLRRNETAERDEVVIASLDGIAFKQVVRVMDVCRTAGFSRVGLSSATMDPKKGI
jgi:biopolymer transport protein ExbD